MAQISKLSIGQVVYSVSGPSYFPVVIKEIDPQSKWVIASRNNNPPRKYFNNSITKWRVNKPSCKEK
jgi:hypothetical protein